MENKTLTFLQDLTVEPFNHKLNGVTGFGTEHECVDWRELMDWMEMNE